MREKKRLPDDPAAAVARARESVEGLTVLARRRPLARLASRRDELRQAMERGRAGRQAREATESRGIQAKAELGRSDRGCRRRKTLNVAPRTRPRRLAPSGSRPANT